MDETLNVRTVREGEALRHPSGSLATNDGGIWPADQFTARRLRDGDVEPVKDTAKAVEIKPAGRAGSNN